MAAGTRGGAAVATWDRPWTGRGAAAGRRADDSAEKTRRRPRDPVRARDDASFTRRRRRDGRRGDPGARVEARGVGEAASRRRRRRRVRRRDAAHGLRRPRTRARLVKRGARAPPERPSFFRRRRRAAKTIDDGLSSRVWSRPVAAPPRNCRVDIPKDAAPPRNCPVDIPRDGSRPRNCPVDIPRDGSRPRSAPWIFRGTGRGSRDRATDGRCWARCRWRWSGASFSSWGRK